MSFGGGSGSSSIAGSTDVVLSSPVNNQVLGYNSSLAKWQNQTGGGTVTFNGSGSGANVFNVRTDGTATGNGSTDDTAALVSAKTSANTLGVPVFLPKGTYVVSSLTLDVAGQVWLLDQGAVIKQKAATTTSGAVIISADGIVFSGGKIDGNMANQTYTWSGGIQVQGSKVVVSDVEVTNCFASGIQLDGTSGPACVGNLITRNYCHDNGKATNAADGIVLTSATYARVTNNRCEYNGLGGGTNEPAYDGNGIQDFTPSSVVTHNLISGNQCSYNARRGIKIQAVGTSVIGNMLARNSCGIGLTDLPSGGLTSETLISGNTISDSYLQGLQVDNCNYVTITGNVIIDSGSHGVGAYGSPTCNFITFTGNTVLRSASNGMNIVSGCANWIISSNQILSSSGWGVALDGTVSKVAIQWQSQDYLSDGTKWYRI